jgi:hypothetical protein
MSRTQTGILNGTVMDTQGAALPGAVVKTTVNSIPEVQVSDYYGEFRFQRVPVGSYTVEATLEGFYPATNSDVEVEVNKETLIELKMQLAINE